VVSDDPKEEHMHGRYLRNRSVATVDEYLKLLGDPQRDIATRLRAIVRERYP